jgi:hypothetical protein
MSDLDNLNREGNAWTEPTHAPRLPPVSLPEISVPIAEPAVPMVEPYAEPAVPMVEPYVEPPEQPLIEKYPVLKGLRITRGIMIGSQDSETLIGLLKQENVDQKKAKQYNANAHAALKSWPESNRHAGVLNNLGCTFTWQCDWQEAREYFQKTQATDQDFGTAKQDATHNLDILDQIK